MTQEGLKRGMADCNTPLLRAALLFVPIVFDKVIYLEDGGITYGRLKGVPFVGESWNGRSPTLTT